MDIGIMQGRLTPSRGRGIQFFPFSEWEEEFCKGRKIGINEIEWIFDYDRYEENPLWTEEGCQAIQSAVDETGVVVRSICFDYFMRRAFYKGIGSREENISCFASVAERMNQLGARLIEVPMVDDSSIKTETEQDEAVRLVRDMADIAGSLGIDVGLETDMEPATFRHFLQSIQRDNVYANYDSGNSSGLGYDHEEEIDTLGGRIANVHIKDRQFHGTTVQLGTGNADFEKLFAALKRSGYKGSFILQAARGDDGREEENISQQMRFVQEYIEKYKIGG